MIPQKLRLEDTRNIQTSTLCLLYKIPKDTTMGDDSYDSMVMTCYVLLFIVMRVMLTYSDCELADAQLQRQAALPYSGTLIPPPQMVLWRHDMRHDFT